MKISLNLIKQYTKTPLDDVNLVVEKIGAQLGAIEEITHLGPVYKGAVAVKVVDCIDHPDSDHMHICQVDDAGVTKDVERNEKGLVQVVCGAPNVAAGVTAVWLPPGATVPESFGKDPFVLGARALRGVVSNGMLASAKELALFDDHKGILLLDDSVKPGTSLSQVADLDDTIIDIENKMFTHRPDCFGQLGVAREIAGIFGQAFTSPDWYSAEASKVFGEGLDLEVINEIPAVVPRFMAITIADVKIADSPLWLKTYLTRIGLRPVNNVVDITNYLMTLTGQPLHAYDYDKVKAQSGGQKAKLLVRYPVAKEKLELLNGKTIELRDKSILITTGDRAIGLGGVMGGSQTEVDAGTSNLILEVATFNMYSIRRTSMAYGIFSDAVTRYTKGQSPLQNDRILAEAVRLLTDIAGGRVASQTFDLNQGLEEPTTLTVSVDFINSRLGLELTQASMAKLLSNVEFQVSTSQAGELAISIPFWRTDIAINEDIVEEIGRLYGFDKLPVDLPMRSIAPSFDNAMLSLKSSLRLSLASAGANETLTYSFVHGDLLGKVGQSADQAFGLSNAISPDIQYYRLSLLPSLLDKLHANIKSGYDRFALFEIGKTHSLIHQNDGEDGLPKEYEALALAYTARDKTAPADAAYYQVKNMLLNLAKSLGLELEFTSLSDKLDASAAKPFEPGRSATVMIAGTDKLLGIVGEFKASVRQALKLQDHTAGFELDLEVILDYIQSRVGGQSKYSVLSRFPSVSQDLCLKVSDKLTYEQIYDFANQQLQQAGLEAINYIIEPFDIYSSEAGFKQITLRFTMVSHTKTMTDKEVSKILDLLVKEASKSLSAERI